MKRIILFTIICFLSLLHGVEASHKNSIQADIDIGKSEITGISEIDITAGEKTVLRTGKLEITRILQNDKPVIFSVHEGRVEFIPEDDGVVRIFYRGVFKATGAELDTGIAESVIDDRGVSLTGTWYPAFETLRHYGLTVTLPEGYEAVSEAETITKEIKDGKAEFNFIFPHPVDGINLVASDRYEIVKDTYQDVEIYAYFFKEDISLAETYIAYTKKYLELYEGLIGTYPYQRFSIVENFLPTGYSMPTYTLLGSSVVKLPFIVETSLGHEILHQWFGNLVYIDYQNGNWAEGLTTYLADHLYKEKAGEGPEYRKQMLIDYMSYVTPEKDMPLKLFTGRSDPATRAIGYGKTAMVFHMLMNLKGKQLFYDALKDFIADSLFRRASWEDIRHSFEKVYGMDLKRFFSQWTEKEGLPQLELEGAEVSQNGKRYNLHFHVNNNKSLYELNLPLTIYCKNTVKLDTLVIDKEENSFDLTLDERPFRIVLDEDYDIARYLDEAEVPPVIARLLGDRKVIVVLPPLDDGRYQSIVDMFKGEGAAVVNAGEVRESEMMLSSVVILGYDNPLIGRLYGQLPTENAGFSVSIKKNPWNNSRVVGIIDGESEAQVDAAFRKLRHYGKYSRLLFDNGRNTEKIIEDSQRGIMMEIGQEASVVDLTSLKTLSDVIKGASDKKIVYVGEIHDVFAHHAVQLDIITGIYRKNPKMAIGMEMFQRQFQETLDAYISGSMTEGDFLKKSEYFKRWGYDYNLYKPILDFARAEKVPVVALNLQREIIEQVSKSGIEALSDEDKKQIPSELDFTDMEYRKRLEEVFNMHKHSGENKFDFFYQSQILWDETMSRSVDEYLLKNPEYQMVVIAGQGHLRYGSGIPLRTYRRNGHDYAVVLIDEDIEKDIADYIVFPKPVEGTTAPKLMAFLKDEDGVISFSGFPDHSVSKKAGLMERDRIVSIDGIEIASIEDIKIHLLYRKKGDVIKVRVKRKRFFIDREIEIDVEL